LSGRVKVQRDGRWMGRRQDDKDCVAGRQGLMGG
jgi:hypothetical protein